MTHNATWLILGGFVCLIGLCVTGMLVLQQQKRDKLWAERREVTIGGYLKPKTGSAPTLMLAPRNTRRKTDVTSQISSIFKWREDRREQYPITWWGAALVMLGPATIGGLLATKVLGVSGWLAVPLIDIMLTRTFLGWAVERVSKALLSQFPDALSMIARSVRVGVPLAESIRVVAREGQAPTRDEFSKAADAVAIGLDLEVALVEMAERNELAEYRFFATALTLQSQTGGGLTETLDTLADTIRKREAARKRGSALASEAKTSIYVLVALPIVTGVALFLTNPDYIGILFTTSGGNKLLALAVFMLCAGLFSMQQIIKRCLS